MRAAAGREGFEPSKAPYGILTSLANSRTRPTMRPPRGLPDESLAVTRDPRRRGPTNTRSRTPDLRWHPRTRCGWRLVLADRRAGADEDLIRARAADRPRR